MWLFVYSATVSLLKNPAAVAGSGITYAEYVHRGFAELSIAATIVIGAILVTRRSWITTDVWARRTAAAALAGECGMIAIAFMRVVRYEQAYGYTTQRLYAQAYMIVLACMSGLLLLEIVRRAQSTRFAYHGATAALTILVACVYFNTDAWIVRENVSRYAATGVLDTNYLVYQLSDDATPALVASLPRLHEPERHLLVQSLLERDGLRTRDRNRPLVRVESSSESGSARGPRAQRQQSPLREDSDPTTPERALPLAARARAQHLRARRSRPRAVAREA